MLARFFLIGILCCPFLLHAQQSSAPEPQYSQQYNAVESGRLVVLERQTAVTDTKSKRFFVITPSTQVFESIPNSASPVRVGPNTHFVVRLLTGDRDPQTMIHLEKLTVGKKDRQVPIVTYKASLIPGAGVNHRRAPDEAIPITVQKYSTDSLEITPQQPLEPGEYAFMEGHDAQCFGVDASGSSETSSAAPAVVEKSATAPPAAPPAAPVAAQTGSAGDFSAGMGLPVLHTSRIPDEGCHWVPFVSTEAHVALLVERCTGANAELSETGKDLVSPYKFGSSTQIIVFTKPAEQSLDKAVRLQVGPHLKPAARLACHIVPDKSEDSSGSAWKWYNFTATSGPLMRQYKAQEPTDLPCEPWEQDDTTVGFLYKPDESKTHFIWVQMGQETPAWDVESIRFLP